MPRSIWLCLALLMLPWAVGSEVAYLCGDDEDQPLDYGAVLPYNGSEVLAFTVAGPGGGEEIEEIEIAEIAKRVEPNDDLVDACANDLVLKFPGDYTIEQIISIHGYVTNQWKYRSDPTGYERFRYANESIKGAPEGKSGFGDCDDFAIVMASLIENIGGTSRIILARGGELLGGHAYPEVY
ncbi:MAG: transglutaminase domain-containing protein, partial [Methanotrichaceae archaeon]|nr:transglutaminase domain-containing protein [Methanotrichaceae archaeon]